MTPMTTASAWTLRRRVCEDLLERGYALVLDGPSGTYYEADDRSHTVWVGWVFPGPPKGSGSPDRDGFRMEVLD